MDELRALGVYAAWNNESIERMMSSSGGMFSAFAAEIFENGGVVYAVEETKCGLSYQRAENMESIRRMQGSKYYQAKAYTIHMEFVYRDIELCNCVLMLGTSCQIGMLRALLMRKYQTIPENVLLIDIICHGVGSKRLVDVYRKELEQRKGKLLNHTFRNKKENRFGSQFSEYTYESGHIEQKDNEDDYYMRFFFPGFFLRPSCYECKYAGKNKDSDVSIGDFNGASRVVKNFPDTTYCISSVIVNTEKGKRFLDQVIINNRISILPTEYSVVAAQNLPLLYPTKRSKVRNYAIKWINKLGFINTCRLLGGKYYIRSVIKKVGGERMLNLIKKMLGRTIIEH